MLSKTSNNHFKECKKIVIRNILQASGEQCVDLFAQLPKKYSYNAAMLLLWQQAQQTSTPIDDQTLEKILDLTHIQPGQENNYISFSTLIELWPREFLELNTAHLLSLLRMEKTAHKGIGRVMRVALRFKKEKIAFALVEELPRHAQRCEILAQVAVTASQCKGHRQASFFLEQAIAAYKDNASVPGLSSIIHAWDNCKLRNRKRVFSSILELCNSGLVAQQNLLLLTDTVIDSQQNIEKHIYAELILEVAKPYRDIVLLEKLLDYIRNYKKLTAVFQRSKQMENDEKHTVMCKYFFQLADFEQNKKKSSQLIAKSLEHLRSVRDENNKLQLLINTIVKIDCCKEV